MLLCEVLRTKPGVLKAHGKEDTHVEADRYENGDSGRLGFEDSEGEVEHPKNAGDIEKRVATSCQLMLVKSGRKAVFLP